MQGETEFVFIHGYTTGLHDFADLPERLARQFNATTYFPILAGHGSVVEDLVHISRRDLFDPIEQHVASSVSLGKRVVIIGLSLGAQAALHLASKYPLRGVVAVSTTHRLVFPLNIPGVSLLLRLKTLWKKNLTPEDLALREGAMVYYSMPTKGFSISKQLRRLVTKNIYRIHSPVLFIHASGDTLGSPKALARLERSIPGPVTVRVIEHAKHSMFFYPEIREQLIAEIITFCKGILSAPNPLED